MTEPRSASKPQGDDPDGGVADGAISLTEVWFAVKGNVWLLVAVTVFAVGIAIAYTSTRTPLYMASATIRFDPATMQPLGRDVEDAADPQAHYWNRDEFYNTQYYMLRSTAVAMPAVRQLGLTRDRGFVYGTAETKMASKPLVSEKTAARMLAGRIRVSPIEESRLARVSYSDASPDRAARIVNAVVQSYINQREAETRQTADQAAEWLDDQMLTLKSHLEESEYDLFEYKKENGILSVSADDQSDMLKAKMAQLSAALTEAEAKRAKVGARRSELRKVSGDDPSDLPTAELMNDDLLRQLRHKYVNATEELESLLGSGKGVGHPKVKALQARRAAAKKVLLDQVQNIKESVEKDYSALNGEIAALGSLYRDAKEKALDLNLMAIEYNRLERERNTNQQLFGLVTERAKETDLTRMIQPSSGRILDPAEPPRGPYTPNTPLNLGAGLLGGLLLGIFLAIVRDKLDSSIRSKEAVEELYGAPCLGVLPQTKWGETPAKKKHRRRRSGAASNLPPRLLADLDPSSSLAESARAIRTNLLLNGNSRSKQVLLVTSPTPGDGKTTVAGALAVSLAEAGRRVVLVDGDLRRPRVHQLFGVPNDTGFASMIQHQGTAEEAVQKTHVENLSVVTCGMPPSKPAELLHSEETAAAIRSLRDAFDYVIIDSPPLLPVADATIMASQVDGTILVGRAKGTKKQNARQAARLLDDIGAMVAGVVLNGVDLSKWGYGYYEKYYYEADRDDAVNRAA